MLKDEQDINYYVEIGKKANFEVMEQTINDQTFFIKFRKNK